MKIGIIAPSPIPFTIGGAEKLWAGLFYHINKNTSNQCELIKIPIKDDNFWALIDSYHIFFKTDFSHFDMVITGKNPAWMIQHENHHVYMLHPLRGLYDTYHLFNIPTNFVSDHSLVKDVLKFINSNNDNLDEFFKILFELKLASDIHDDLFRFPGPFIRKVIHFLDSKGMSKVKEFYAISKTVAKRKDYFPSGINAKVIYPPSNLEKMRSGKYEYLFTVSRLDRAKRVKMIVEAYMASNSKIPLKIAGTGPLEKELKVLAKNDNRIEFLGFISDQDLIEYYANAYAVVFIPYDEDYGIVTIEAMMSQKPIITFSDSGGVTEFVKDGETGYICYPSFNGLKQIIEQICSDIEHVKYMGMKAKKSVEYINWNYVVKEILQRKTKTRGLKEKKITVITTYPIYPPRGGAQNRIFYLYKEIAKEIIVEAVCLSKEGEDIEKQQVVTNLFEIKVPKSVIHSQKEWEIEEKMQVPVTDIAMLYLYEETKEFINTLIESCKNSVCIICEQPYLYEMLKKYTDRTIILDCHNVEYLLKKSILPENEFSNQFLKKLFSVEKMACEECNAICACSDEDASLLQQLYGIEKKNIFIIPNGVDLKTVKFTPLKQRCHNKEILGLNGERIVFFMGAWHQPNIDAVELIFEMAKILRHVKFLIVGSVSWYFKQKEIPKNVGFMGVLNNEEKDFVLSLADVALNPMLSGSGTNLKMLDYMAAGIPVISTEIGARGLKIPNDLITVCGIDQFTDMIIRNPVEDNIIEARKFVEKHYSWELIGKKMWDILNRFQLV